MQDAGTCTGTLDDATPTATQDEGAPAATNDKIAPAATNDKITPAATNDKITPAATNDKITPAATNDKITPATQDDVNIFVQHDDKAVAARVAANDTHMKAEQQGQGLGGRSDVGGRERDVVASSQQDDELAAPVQFARMPNVNIRI
jgi:hypothetical protein